MLLLAATLFLTTCLGCGERGPGLIPVAGQVTYGGGAWPQAGKIYFNPVQPAEGFSKLSGSADFAADGSFTVQSTGNKQGLLPGKYRVNLECWEEQPSMAGATPTPGKSYVPEGWVSPEIEIPVGAASHQVTIDVPKRK